MILKKQLTQTRNAIMEQMPRHIMQVFLDSISELKRNKIKDNALQVGDTIPNISLKNNEGNSVLISEMIPSDFLILNFYRGGWCPYCNLELREYERLRKDFKAIRTDIVGISAENIQRGNTTVSKNELTFPILTDTDAALMKAMGIVFPLNEDSKKEFRNFGMDFTEIHENKNYELPVPAVYVVNKELEIVHLHFEEDYMTRLEPSELLNTLIKHHM